MVSFDPAALEKGGTALTAKAEVVLGHATTVANLTALRTAFGELGAQAWQAVEAELEGIRRQLDDAGGRTTHTGATMGFTGRGAAGLDQDHQNAIRNAGR